MYYIGGDFNADLLKSNSDTNIEDWLDIDANIYPKYKRLARY